MNESVGWMRQLLEKKEMAEMPRKGDFSMALGKIEKSIERARKITHQLLSLVRKQEPVLSEVNVKTLLEEAKGLILQEAARKKIDIILDADGRATIWSDPYQLRQVFINLLTNALHATSPGGKIIMAFEDRGHEIDLTVSDTGQGIPKENMTKIFEPFFTTKNPGEGTGLGLFVSRGIVEKLGGTIEVESKLGQGSRLRVTLPKHYEIKE